MLTEAELTNDATDVGTSLHERPGEVMLRHKVDTIALLPWAVEDNKDDLIMRDNQLTYVL